MLVNYCWVVTYPVAIYPFDTYLVWPGVNGAPDGGTVTGAPEPPDFLPT